MSEERQIQELLIECQCLRPLVLPSPPPHSREEVATLLTIGFCAVALSGVPLAALSRRNALGLKKSAWISRCHSDRRSQMYLGPNVSAQKSSPPLKAGKPMDRMQATPRSLPSHLT
eukprot:TRINITY_DN11708_c0_g1_i3.p3 TRINITY_DN11708_c0_g1~~TRINITY_DN11708_c0_g1_i3.p3  ORF type:complete len:116 (-),score=17.55 TRINITY_DN11708_c0_g1_i3:96-443(-)